MPEALRSVPHWVCWKYIAREGKHTKCPVDAHDGKPANSTDPLTWATFEEAVAAWRRRGYAGVGFAFSGDDPFTGVDLDGCIDESGDIVPSAKEIIDSLDSYTEISPGGRGVKIFVAATKPSGAGCRSKAIQGFKETEIYQEARVFTVTGRHLAGTPLTIGERQTELEALCGRLWAPKKPPLKLVGTPALAGFNGDDEALLKHAGAAKNGDRFKRLWDGDTSMHGDDQSAADQALCNMLAFWTAKDADRIDRLFRRSGLYREKWDERRGDRTYGQRTIDRALAGCTEVYSMNATAARRLAPPVDARPDEGSYREGAIPLGERDPASGRLVLSPKRTLPTAEAYIQEFNTHRDGPTLHAYGGALMEWHDNRYRLIEEGSIRQRLQPWLHAALRYVVNRHGVPELVNFDSNPTSVKYALETIRSFTHLPVSTPFPSWLDGEDRPPALEVLPCKTLNLHIPTGRILPATPALFNVNALEFDYDPDPEPPELWTKFLEQLFGDDLESVELLQEWAGYCLTSDTSQQKMLLLVGPRRSGKGTTARILTRLVGAGNVVGPTTGSLAGQFGLQPLIDKSLAIVSDARFSGENVATVVERLLCISGEDTLTVDRKYLGSVSMKLSSRRLVRAITAHGRACSSECGHARGCIPARRHRVVARAGLAQRAPRRRSHVRGGSSMTAWYIKSGESGGGTSTADYAGSWGAIDASLADGDTVYIHGSSVLREQIALTEDSVTIAAEPGTGRWTQTGRRLLAPGDWSIHSGGLGRTVYKATVHGTVVGLVYDYRLGTAEGVPELYVGHVPETAEATLVDFVADIGANDRPSWFYDAAGETLYAYFPGNDDPRSSGKSAEWLEAMTDHGFRPDGCAGLRMSGGRIDCWWDNSASNYWGLALTGCTACLVEDMEFSDCYFHSAGCTGGACAGNVFKTLTCRTARRGTDGHIVQFAGSGETLAGGVFQDCTLHLAGSRDYNGDPLETTGTMRGVAGHAGGSIAAQGLIFRRITTVRYPDEESAGGAVSVVHSGGGAAPSDPASAAAFPILHEDCVYEDFGAANLSASTSHAAFRRCRFVTDGTVTNGAASTAAINVAAGCKSCFESCTLSGEMSASTNHILIRAAGAVYLSNCTVRAAGATDAIIFGAVTSDIDAVHCLFAASSSGRLGRGGTMPPPVFTKCWYDQGFGDTLFAVPAAFNTQTEWAASIDPGGTYDVDLSAAFADTDTLEPAADSAVWTTKDIHANPARPRGVNGNKYAGNPGAWQSRPQGSMAAIMGRGRSRDWRTR